MERMVAFAILVSALGLSQANILSPGLLLGQPLRRSEIESGREARETAENAKNEINQFVEQLAAIVSETKREAAEKKRDLPSIMDSWLSNDALTWAELSRKRDTEFGESLAKSLFDTTALEKALGTNKRDSEKSFTDALDSVVQQVNDAIDAGEKKRREEPNVGNGWSRHNALNWGLDNKKREAGESGGPSLADALFHPEAFADAFKMSKKRNTESLNEKLDSIVNKVNAALDAGDMKRREEPSVGQAMFNGFPFAMRNLEGKRDAAQDSIKEEVNSLVDEIDQAIGSDFDEDQMSRRGILPDCVNHDEVCHPLQHCCGSLKCKRRKFYHIRGRCRHPNEPY